MSRLVRPLAVAAAVVLLSCALVFSSFWHQLQSGGQWALRSAMNLAAGVSSQTFALFRGPSLQRENQALRVQLATLAAGRASCELTQQENVRLRELSQLPVPAGTNPIGLEVVGEETDEAGTRFLVNRGSSEGLRVGMPVVVGTVSEAAKPSAVLVGVLTDVGPAVSSYHPVTSGAARVPVEVGQGRVRGLAVGEYGLAVRVRYLPLDQVVATNDLVVSSNVNPALPAGLLLGRVSTVETPEGEFFKSAVVTPAVPLDGIRYVWVLRLPQL